MPVSISVRLSEPTVAAASGPDGDLANENHGTS
jgi:hypothetical protein